MTAGDTVLRLPSDVEIVVMRQFRAPVALVFATWTQPEHLRRWFGRDGWSLPVCEIDLRPGGAWRYVHLGPDGMELGLSGEYLEVDPPHRLVSTERFDEPYFEAMGGGTVNTITFDEDDGGITTMTLRVLYASKEARDGALQTGMEEGMAEGFRRLDAHLAGLA
ncbi:MAG: SRPBCC family protein [Dehalococcoidia bacterium]|nr:SRPBCC family protein [Dehalococcoidia bacterium]HRC62084.1 SRPBCC family protein [Dehalococcoidia bacterium]